MFKRACVVFAFFSQLGIAQLHRGQIPGEVETAGGSSLGFGNSATSAVSDLGSVRTNPAMLSVEQHYQVSGNYHWPAHGREYYQAGIVDSKTSGLAAGAVYSGSNKKYLDPSTLPTAKQKNGFLDSSFSQRISVGFAQSFEQFSLGVGFQYVEGRDADFEKLHGATFGAGVAGLLTKRVRFGLSAENITNSSLGDLVPPTYRVGIAYILPSETVTFHLDYRHRQRVFQENYVFQTDNTRKFQSLDPEQMVLGSFSLKVQDLIRVFGAYGQSVSSVHRASVSGGLALVNRNVSLSYMVSRPQLTDESVHHGVGLTLNVLL